MIDVDKGFQSWIYLPKTRIYIDRIGGTYYYTRLYGVSWRKHVRSMV